MPYKDTETRKAYIRDYKRKHPEKFSSGGDYDRVADELIHELRLYSGERCELVERFVLAIRRLGEAVSDGE